ncbi:hypothetical protein M9H77_31911 [Catharanthus roseus]|uniref:Uncharacterized protein n=1 Tax=Catharanthus roseus TaxID=4058 RepID=A0ACC0A2A8_CATRO|nr:hypothetical protein M9H77_31911 [Catharanthus roseus]
MGRNKLPTIPTADGPDNRTIPTAAGGPPSEVTIAAMVLEFKIGWLLQSTKPLPTSLSSLFSRKVFSANKYKAKILIPIPFGETRGGTGEEDMEWKENKKESFWDSEIENLRKMEEDTVVEEVGCSPSKEYEVGKQKVNEYENLPLKNDGNEKDEEEEKGVQSAIGFPVSYSEFV